MHPDRIDARAHHPPERCEPPVRQLGAAARTRHIIGECGSVGVSLEPEQIVAAHGAHQRGMRRHRHQHARLGERRMQKQAQLIFDTSRPQRIGKAEQVVVVHPDKIVRLQQPRQRLREQLIHPPVAGELVPVEPRQPDLVVQHRPQRAVGEASVELVVVAPRQVHREHGDRSHCARGMRRRFGLRRYLAAPAEPDAALGTQSVQHSDGQSSGRRFPLGNRRDPVRDDDQARHCQWSVVRKLVAGWGKTL